MPIVILEQMFYNLNTLMQEGIRMQEQILEIIELMKELPECELIAYLSRLRALSSRPSHEQALPVEAGEASATHPFPTL